MLKCLQNVNISNNYLRYERSTGPYRKDLVATALKTFWQKKESITTLPFYWLSCRSHLGHLKVRAVCIQGTISESHTVNLVIYFVMTVVGLGHTVVTRAVSHLFI